VEPVKKLVLVFCIILTLTLIFAGDLQAADFGLFDDYQFMAGAMYTRPEMSGFTEFFEGEYGAMADENQVFADLLDNFNGEDFEGAEMSGYSFRYNTDYPSGPMDSFGVYLNLINSTEFGYRALLNYDLFRLDFNARGNNELSVKFDGDFENYNEAELIYENSSEIDVEMLIHSFGAEYHFPFFSGIDNQLPDLLRFFNFNVGGAYYWGYGEMTSSEYKLEQLIGEDSDGDPVDRRYESSSENSYNLTLAGSPGYKVGVGFDYPLQQGMMVSAGVNYRVLEMDIETSGNGDEIIGDMTEDFSGLEMKLGLFYQF